MRSRRKGSENIAHLTDGQGRGPCREDVGHEVAAVPVLAPPCWAVKLGLVAADELLAGLAGGVVPEPAAGPAAPEVVGQAVLAALAVVRLARRPVISLQAGLL